MIARRHAPGHLNVDDAVAHAIAAQHLAHHGLERRLTHRRRDLELRERAPEALQMQALVHQAPALDRDHLVDAVGELVAAILDVDGGLAVR